MSVKKVEGKGNSKWKISLFLSMYYAVRKFFISKLYVLRVALRHEGFSREGSCCAHWLWGWIVATQVGYQPVFFFLLLFFPVNAILIRSYKTNILSTSFYWRILSFKSIYWHNKWQEINTACVHMLCYRVLSVARSRNVFSTHNKKCLSPCLRNHSKNCAYFRACFAFYSFI